MDAESNSKSRTFVFADRSVNTQFESNYISSTRYNIATFLPLSLFLQFRRIANVYFLITAVLQSIPEISPLNPFSAVAPLVVVLFISIVREGYEDFKRLRADQLFNSTPTLIYQNGAWKEHTFKDVQVGDLVKVRKNEFFPCDLIVLNSSNLDAITFIETSSLDGEKNLKTKQGRLETLQFFKDDYIEFFADFTSEDPSPKLDEFIGNMKIREGLSVPLDIKQLLLCGASLRNTEWAIGIAVFTGKETKLRQNLMERRYKQSQIEHKVNQNITLILGMQAILCLIAAVYGGAWVSVHYDSHWYLGDQDFSASVSGFFLYCTYFLLLNTMIPISLIVTLEVVKLGQAYFMSNDLTMYSALRDQPCKVSDSTLNEELGQIQHIFTDKTGTLTCNRMEFKLVTIGEQTFGDRGVLINREFSRKPSHIDDVVIYAFEPSELRQAMSSKEILKPMSTEEDLKPSELDAGDIKGYFKKMSNLVEKFMQGMALSHDLLVEYDAQGCAKYNGNSPDEICLVDAARRIGVKYLGVDQNTMKLAYDTDDIPEMQLKQTETHDFERLAYFEFTSDRRRASVLVKDLRRNLIWLFMKGADSAILDALGENNCKDYVKKAIDDLDSYSNDGYRTLVYACRLISHEEYNDWRVEYDKALNNIHNRNSAIADCASILEVKMTLLGCVAYEDKLQAGVPDTIYDLRQADIKIWMLTGDKLGTAVCVGKSCKLIEDNMKLLKIRELPIREANAKFKKIEMKIQKIKQDPLSRQKIALCIEGRSIGYMFYKADDPLMQKKYPDIAEDKELTGLALEMQQIFMQFAFVCDSVICCRASPMEKASIVRLMKSKNTVTLSIGDGANDVPMILEAHIGVGLFGEEGMQAVQSSDYAIGEFQYLWELLLAHGHWNYIRQSEMILYFFYKNFLFTFPQFLFCFFCVSSGRTVHDDWYISLYNLAFTSLPLFVRALFETDRDPPMRGEYNSIAMRTEYAKLYKIGQSNKIFNKRTFIWWVFKGFIHSIVVFFISYAAFDSGILTTNGKNTDLVSFSVIQFTCIMVVVNLELGLSARAWSWLLVTSIWVFSIGIYVSFVFVYDLSMETLFYSSILEVVRSPYLYLCVILCSCISLVSTGPISMWENLRSQHRFDNGKLKKTQRKEATSEKYLLQKI